jgi:DNA-binding MarR family transcriptional regulator
MSRIQRELKQSKPFSSKAEEAAVALMRTADLLRRNVEATIGAFGITAQQYNVLRILRGAGERGLPTLDIAERMIEETPGITRLIDRLEAKALVARERCATDRRQVFCRITNDGLALLDATDAPMQATNAATLGGIPETELKRLVNLLDRVRDGLDRHLAVTRQQRKEPQS